MSFDYANHALHISHDSFAFKNQWNVQAAVQYNMAADALILSAGRIQERRESFLELLVDLCESYFYFLSEDLPDAADKDVAGIFRAVEHEYPSVYESAEFHAYFTQYQKAAETLARVQKEEKHTTIKESN